jgi:hypothetical protein
MKKIVVLCGVENSGKTNTMKSFFSFKGVRWSRNRLFQRIIDGKTFYAVGANSPQELNRKYKEETDKFVELIKARIEEALRICEKEAIGKEYVLILPFTIYRHKKGKAICEESIREPIEYFRGSFKVKPIYLQRKDCTFPDEFMLSIIDSKKDIISSDMNYERQARELEKLVLDP